MSIYDLPPCSVTELKGMFGPADRTVSIEEMNRAIGAQGAEARAPRGADGAPATGESDEGEAK